MQLVSAQVGTAQTVYNFEVEDYHTYFVGNSEVWVHNANCGNVPNGTSLGKDHVVTYKAPHPEAGVDATDFDEILKVGDDYWFIQDKLNTSGSAETVAKSLRKSLSNYEKALRAHFADQLTNLPSGVNLDGKSLTDLKFGARIRNPNSQDPEFQRKITEQITQWEKRHPDMGKITVEFL